jgi:hypothetical protein
MRKEQRSFDGPPFWPKTDSWRRFVAKSLRIIHILWPPFHLEVYD